MASVFLGDVDDFIAPGQACINPLFTTAEDAKAAAAGPEASSGSKGGAAMVLELEDDGGPLDTMVVEEAVKPDLIKPSNTQTAKVSLDDCLACSGCVTSAETVLITQQSTGKLREAVESGRHSVVVASITPQARASLAERLGLSTAETHARLLTFLRERQGVHHLIDSSLGADFSLLEAGEEFVRRWRHGNGSGSPSSSDVVEGGGSGGGGGGCGGGGPQPARVAWVAPPPTVALSSTRRFNVDLGREESNRMQQEQTEQQQQQQQGVNAASSGGGGGGGMNGGIVSGKRVREDEGSGEKTAPEALPLMSTVKSPQQMMGVLAKRVFPRAWNQPPPAAATAASNGTVAAGDTTAGIQARQTGVYHVSIAQCYDKKLEASRKDFRHEDLDGEAEVDLVLTTAEVLELIQDTAAAAAAATPADGYHADPMSDATTDRSVSDTAGDFFRRHSPPGDLAEPLAPGFPVAQAAASADGLALFGGLEGEEAAGGGSGGYLEYVFRHAAWELFGVDLAGRPLVYVEGRNSDFRETSLEVNGQVVLRFAYAYGFRNIQSILAKARRGKCPYHFIEVMACPSGCVNGGGQIKPKKREGPRDTRQRVEKVSKVLREGRVPRGPGDNPLVQLVYADLAPQSAVLTLGGALDKGPVCTRGVCSPSSILRMTLLLKAPPSVLLTLGGGFSGGSIRKMRDGDETLTGPSSRAKQQKAGERPKP
eukprot:g11483.t1